MQNRVFDLHYYSIHSPILISKQGSRALGLKVGIINTGKIKGNACASTARPLARAAYMRAHAVIKISSLFAFRKLMVLVEKSVPLFHVLL